MEDQDLYYDNRNGVLVEVSALEKRVRRKKGLEKVQNLPGKLDHVTVVAYNVGNYAYWRTLVWNEEFLTFCYETRL